MNSPIGKYKVHHKAWADDIDLLPNGIFTKGSSIEGYWESIDNKITLHWYSWAPEVVLITSTGFASDAMRGIKLIDALPEPTKKIWMDLEHCIGLGDKLCALSAAREYAQKNHISIYISNPCLLGIIQAYRDNLISFGKEGQTLSINAMNRHRVKISSPDINYVGSYLSALGIEFVSPVMDLPKVEALTDLTPQTYIAFQPYSNFASNPNDDFLAMKWKKGRHYSQIFERK
jgi:hypothetical protein